MSKTTTMRGATAAPAPPRERADRDRRGRVGAALPILHYGFRPFFFLASLHAGLAVPAWLWLFLAGPPTVGPFAGLQWHVHEMLFGYLAAVIAGFILTAVPNWTGRLPLSGRPLAVLVALWLAGRAAAGLISEPVLAMAVDLAFPAALAFAVWREVVAGRNWRNAPVAGLITLFGIANALHHGANLDLVDAATGPRLALGAAALLMALIGGRIVPSFTRNWLVKTGDGRLPAPAGRLDAAALAATALAVLAWLVAPEAAASGVLLIAAGAALAARLARWRGLAVFNEPMLLVLHAGYGWLALSLLLLGAANLTDAVAQSAAIHALTAGAVGTMTLAVMTRASLGHTGRAIVADRAIVAIFWLVTAGAAARVAAPLAGGWYLPVLVTGGALWSGAFLLFAIRYAPVLFGPRRTA